MTFGACVECGSTDTELERNDDGHFEKTCRSCDHVGGPYVSPYERDGPPSGGQAGLSDFT